MYKSNDFSPAVMLLFFNRPEQLRQVFAWVQRVQPPKLFLVQDGARPDRPDDLENIQKCRDIVSDITWECEVHRNYAEENMSCDHREFTGISWCFQFVDRLIILEDDCVPVDSFYPFCAELLERYKGDERVHSISGFNRVNTFENGYSYVFSKSGAGWGWATWKRVWNDSEKNRNFDFLKDSNARSLLRKGEDDSLQKMLGDLIQQADSINARQKAENRIVSWEYLSGLACYGYNRLVITPCKNMIHYTGISENATHCTGDERLLPAKVRRMLTQNAYEMDFPVSHPPFIVRDLDFEKANINAWPKHRVFTLAEVMFYKLKYKGFREVMKSIAKRLGMK